MSREEIIAAIKWSKYRAKSRRILRGVVARGSFEFGVEEVITRAPGFHKKQIVAALCRALL